MSTFHLTIAKVGESLWDGDARSLSIKTAEGEVTILPHHEAYVAPTMPHTAKVIDTEAHTHDIELLEAGILEVSHNQVTVIL